MAAMVEGYQIKKMWAIAKAIGLTDEELYCMADTDSLKSITKAKAGEVIRRLAHMQGSYTPSNGRKSKTEKSVPGMATSGQKKKIWALMYQLKDLDIDATTAELGDRLCGIIKKELGITALSADPFVWVDFQSANKLIEILKKYIENTKARKLKEGDASGVD